jgi:prepilin-type N-terminal cleavage/methylation domain-containing protein
MNRVDVRESKNRLGGWLSAARRRLTARNDAGVSMIELLVAVVVIAVVLLSGTTAIDFALSSSNAQRFKVEATTLGVTSMERDEQLAPTLGIGQTTVNKTLGNTTFTVVTSVTDFDQNGSSLTTVCTASSASVAQQIWQITVTVTWPHMNGIPPITESTEVAPGQNNALDLSNGEIAVAVNGVTGTYLTTPLNFTLTPQYIGSGTAPAYPTPSGQTDPAGTIFNTGDYGCGVVTGLSTSPSWNYIVTLTNNPGWVSSTELGDTNFGGDPTQTLTALAGEVSRTVPPFQMAQGVLTTISLQPVTYSCAGGSPVPACYSGASPGNAVADLPVTFGNSSLPNGQYTFGSGTTAIGGGTEYLYPDSAYDVWSGDMAQSSPGALVTASSNFVYAGPTGTQTPAPVVMPVSGTPASVKVPTYSLNIQVAGAGYCSTEQLTAKEQSGAALTYDLNPASPSGYLSTSGMPLGQYWLSDTGGTCSGLSSSGGPYVWITPSGVYQATAPMATPYSGTLVAGSVQVSE